MAIGPSVLTGGLGSQEAREEIVAHFVGKIDEGIVQEVGKYVGPLEDVRFKVVPNIPEDIKVRLREIYVDEQGWSEINFEEGRGLTWVSLVG